MGDAVQAIPPDQVRIQMIAVLLLSAATCLGIWALGEILVQKADQWHKRFLAEAEYELEDMLLQMPGASMLNYSFIVAGVAGVLSFLFFGSMGDNWNWKVGVVFGAVTFGGFVWLSRLLLRFLRKRRLERFNDQLEEALMSMSNSLKAGFSITQAIEMVVKQNKHPISLEFKLMLQQTHLGVSLDEALQNMNKRVASEDFQLVSSAIATARQTGGDLTGVFDRLATMIRERLRIQRRIRTLTAQGRLQGMVLGALPLVLLAVLYMLDADLVRGFFTKPLGVLLFFIVIILDVCGFLVIRKIVAIDI